MTSGRLTGVATSTRSEYRRLDNTLVRKVWVDWQSSGDDTLVRSMKGVIGTAEVVEAEAAGMAEEHCNCSSTRWTFVAHEAGAESTAGTTT